MRTPRPLAALLASATLFAAPASATWSIILVNIETREVVIASATCLANFDLEVALPVVRVGYGAAAAQSLVDSSGVNRQLIWDSFIAEVPPANILQLLAGSDPQHQSRQYGIVDVLHNPAKFTGNGAGKAKKALAGKSLPWIYSVQGNVLTADQVIDDAVAALLSTPGDASQKVMAAMEAARALGGDGRCSCSILQPTSCGAPPPSFTKAAHIGFLVVARMGDSDGTCSGQAGCTNGSYHLNLNVIGSIPDPDPVLTLQSLYGAWRASQAGVPDQLLSSAKADVQSLVADGASSAQVTVQLVDLDGLPLGSGGAALGIASAGGGATLTQVGAVTDNGDGSYTFALTAGTSAGVESLAITADDGSGPVLLYPYLELRVDPLVDLHCGFDAVSAAQGAQVPLTLNTDSNAVYLVLASLSGTAPGVPLGFGTLPLNPDPLVDLSLVQPNQGPFVNTLGSTDALGHAAAGLSIPPGVLGAVAGGRIDLAALVLGAGPSVTAAAGFDIEP
ncbi:DUF1028 domain-containing protein [Engelhardtia mirabilis]|uniref:Invasin domain-containing protein n=1 Tax=Engelhardtia mirabilis TaxID=2528011 RepID=A0A518BMZ6_9BACT|nr:hypothetical protein Pla133_34500 [Planctomycetes bacterium Pla133]QDV02680.1 hypothetical protein Pla86_34490 [Planctomycetes bacterium Pla86]